MKLKSFFCLTLFLYSVTVFSQTNFNYNHYLLIDKNLNHLDSKVHTSIKPFFIDHKEFILSDVNSIESRIFLRKIHGEDGLLMEISSIIKLEIIDL